MRLALAVLFGVVVLACSSPHSTPLPKDLSNIDSIKPALEKLTQQERELMAGYMLRHRFGSAFEVAFGVKSDPIPDGMTIGKAIEEQKAFVAKREAEEAAKKAEDERTAANRKALAAQMAQVVRVRLTNLSLHKATYRDMDVQSRINLTFEFENKGTKDIAGIKGVATFKDKFGDTVATLPLKMDQVIPAGRTVTVRLGKDFNQFDTKDRTLANLESSSATLELAPEVVLFADGSKFEAPTVAKD